jgi:acyl carrier protein
MSKTFDEKFKSLTAIETQLFKIASEQTGELPMDINANTKLGKYMDSLEEVEFVMAVEEFFDVEINDDEALKHNTIAKATQLINSKINGVKQPTLEDFPDDWFTTQPMEAPTGKVFTFRPWDDLTDRQHKVIHALLGERVYQDKMWNEETTGSRGVHSPTEWLVFIQHYLNIAIAKASTQKKEQEDHDVMDNIRKIGAMCMAAMEQNQIVEREDE